MIYSYKYGRDLYQYNNQDGYKTSKYEVIATPQSQEGIVGKENLMNPLPIFDNTNYQGSNKLKDKVAIITGADSGLGKSAAIHFVKEGAKVVIPYYNEHQDAQDTKNYIEQLGGECLLLSGDISDPNFSKEIVQKTLQKYGKIDILVNNAGVQYQQDNLEDITNEQFDWTLKVNIYGIFYLTKECLPYLKKGSSIINVSSVTTFYGEPQLIDYVTSKGAIIGFTRSLARNLATKGIRVNAIAPGYYWTALQPNCWEPKKVPTLGADAAMARCAMPYELAPTFVYLASNDSTYVTGQTLHNNGGQFMG